MLQEVVSCAHVAGIRVDDSGEHVSLNDGLILGQAIIDFTKGSWGIVLQPACLSKKDLRLSEG